MQNFSLSLSPLRRFCPLVLSISQNRHSLPFEHASRTACCGYHKTVGRLFYNYIQILYCRKHEQKNKRLKVRYF